MVGTLGIFHPRHAGGQQEPPPVIVSASDNLTPPNAAYVSPPNDPPIIYQNGIRTRNYIHDRLALHPFVPVLGKSAIYVSGGRVRFDVLQGDTPLPVIAEAKTTVRLTHVDDVGATQIFSTEMLQLDIFGGNLPQGIQLRVSPTQPSRGRATIERVEAGFLLSSFFDIFTEVSRDGGQTWSPALRSQRVQLESRAPAIFSVSDNLTPPNGAYMSPANSPEIRYPLRIITRFYNHDWMRLHFTLPPLGGPPVIYQSPGRVQFQVSVNGGESFSDVLAEANTTVRMIHNQDVGPVQFFDTQMLQLDIFGGNLPDGVRLRISPDRRAVGQATIQTVPGGFQLSSFFDIFTDISLDDGKTWLPALDQQRVALTPRAPEVVSKEPELTPPNGAYVSAVNAEAIVYPGLNIITRKYKHDRMTLHRLPPLLGESVLYTSPGRVQFEVSFDGGSKFSPVSANADTAVRLAHSQDVGPIQFFSTEMTQLDIFGGDLPPGVGLRVSPTLKSGGQATILPNERGFLLSSFFDIFTEVTTDDGKTWTPAATGQRVALESRAPALLSATPDLTPPNSAYISPVTAPAIPYPNNIFTRNYFHFGLLPCPPPPILNERIIYASPGFVRFEVSLNGGRDYRQVSAEANTTVRLAHTADVEAIRFFDTEMLQLDIFGGDLPAGVRLRVSPTQRSLGNASIEDVPGGFSLSSFFDIFTEISLDDGETWAAAFAPQRVVLARVSGIESASSIGQHGMQGRIEIPLNLTDPPTSDPRLTVNEILVVFNGPVRPSEGDLTPEQVVITSTPANAVPPYTVSFAGGGNVGQELTILFSQPLSDQHRYRISFEQFVEPNGDPLSGDTDLEFRVLQGDANDNGAVTATDVSFVRGRINQPVAFGATSRADGNMSGTITGPDISFVRSRIGHSAP
jgi:hypothetical protein